MTRQVFQERVAAHLAQTGFAPNTYTWAAKPTRLLLIVKGEFRELPMRAGMSKEKLAFQLGRIAGWAEMMKVA